MSQFQASNYFMRISSSQAAATNKALSIDHRVLRDAAASKAVCASDDKVITIIITLTVPMLVKAYLPHWHGWRVTNCRSSNL